MNAKAHAHGNADQPDLPCVLMGEPQSVEGV
jgi:hypothetical protein